MKRVNLRVYTRQVNSREVQRLFGDLRGAKQALQPYRDAIKNIKALIGELNEEYSGSGRLAPIHRVETRLKSARSIAKKLERRSLPVGRESIGLLTDIAGMRIICNYIDDVYTIADYFESCGEVAIARESDYIENQKPNGYRSLHLILETEVPAPEGFRVVPVEVQIRTIAMDYWASLEHKIRYKTSKNVSAQVLRQLRECADMIHLTDMKMLEINQILREEEILANYDYE